VSGTDIFLSYARTDRAAARMFAEAFADEGFSVWWDASLHSGETFDEVIEQRLRDAKAVVVLWSPRSVASRWVRAEATQADRKNKLAPAIIEPCDRPIIFELTHAADLCEWTGDITDIRWRMFVDDLRRLIQHESVHEAHHAAQAPAKAQPAPRQPLRPGSDEVIFAGKTQQEVPAAQPEAQASGLHLQPVAEADAAAEVHCLELDLDDLGEELFLIESSSVKIGRVAPADIVLSHKSVSREHCMIGVANDELLVTDLNSTNGTYIDGQRLSRATVLPVGAELRLGQVTLRHTVRKAGEALPGAAGHRGGLQPGRTAAAR
jgi:TIR domain/FHA domain